jgi:transcriptional regulator with XRE-family HTH domain
MFGEYVRAKREAMGLSLREFCDAHNFDAGNTSKMERGELPPPESDELVRRYGRALGLADDSNAMEDFRDLAAASRGKIPLDIMQRGELLKTLPRFFKTLRLRKDSFEEDVKDRFLSYLIRERGTAYITTDVNVIVDPVTRRDFDFELTPIDDKSRPIALEIFRLVDSEQEVASTRLHGQAWNTLKDELTKRGIKDFSIRTPSRFLLSKAKIGPYCERIADIIEAIVKRNPSVEEFEVEGFKGTRFEGLGTIGFVSYGGPGFVDSVSTSEEALSAKLRHKEDQLPTDGYERILLAVNWIMFVGAADAISALAMMDLDFLSKTDRIYFESSPGNFALVYDRCVRAALDSIEDPPKDPSLASLYHAWLANRIGSDPKAFRLVQAVSARLGTVYWLPDRYVRERIVWAANDRVKNGKIEDGLWVARQFRHDPDPPLCNYPDDPEGKFNLHEQVNRGASAGISSVRGSLCWLLQRLVVHGEPDLFPQIIEMLENLARDENLYVRQQATVPLAELARRRLWRGNDKDFLMDVESRQRTLTLALEMLRSNAKHLAILEWLGTVFEHVLDLDESSAEAVLGIFSGKCPAGARDAFSWLLIYFAVYRESQFPDLAKFDGSWFKKLLVESIQRGSEDLRRTLAWRFHGAVVSDIKQFEKLREFIKLIPEGPYQKTVFFYFFSIANSLPADLRNEWTAVIDMAVRKEKDIDSECPAYSDAEMMRHGL